MTWTIQRRGSRINTAPITIRRRYHVEIARAAPARTLRADTSPIAPRGIASPIQHQDRKSDGPPSAPRQIPAVPNSSASPPISSHSDGPNETHTAWRSATSPRRSALARRRPQPCVTAPHATNRRVAVDRRFPSSIELIILGRSRIASRKRSLSCRTVVEWIVRRRRR